MNDCATWASDAVYRQPSFNVGAFQTKLDKIAGKRRGRSVVRLVWAGSKECFSRYYDDWDEFGNGIRTELRAKYIFASIRIPGTNDRIDVPPPRWILEERHEPEQYAESWEQARWVYSPYGDGTDRQRKVERRPPPPSEYYSHLWTVSAHDEQCCELTKQNGIKTCWGKYKQPGEDELQIIRRAVAEREKGVYQSPFEQLSEASLADVDQYVKDVTGKKAADADAELKQWVDDNALALIAYYTGADLTDKTKKFSIPTGYKQTESGLIVGAN